MFIVKMLNTWRRERPNRRRTASAAGVAASVGRAVARRIQEYAPALPGGNGSAGHIGIGAALGAAASIASRSRSSSRAVSTYNKVMGLGLGHGSGGVVRKKKKGGKRRKLVISKGLKEAIKRSLKASKRVERAKVSTWLENGMLQLLSAVNKVAWGSLHAPSYASIGNYTSGGQIVTSTDGITSVVNVDYEDLSASAAKKFLIKQTFKGILKNNASSPCELVIYHVRATDDTNNGPLTDLTDRISAGYNTRAITNPGTAPSAPLAKEDNFYQYWTTVNMKDCAWKIVKQDKFMLASGDEVKIFFNVTQRYVSHAQNATTYQKGMEHIVYRIMGRPAHSVTTTTNLGVTNTLVDALLNVKSDSYSLGDPLILKAPYTVANAGVSATDPGIGGDAFVAPVEIV